MSKFGVSKFGYLGAADFSICGKYRYKLNRDLMTATGSTRPALFIMLNPSTADEFQNDPTITRCINFARREGCGYLTVVNLFAYRSTDPKALSGDPQYIGPRNKDVLRDEILIHKERDGLIVAAWGANPLAEPFNREFQGVGFYCLGKNKNGSPKHPLYVPNRKKLELF